MGNVFYLTPLTPIDLFIERYEDFKARSKVKIF
jgi:hypothetical protein